MTVTSQFQSTTRICCGVNVRSTVSLRGSCLVKTAVLILYLFLCQTVSDLNPNFTPAFCLGKVLVRLLAFETEVEEKIFSSTDKISSRS